jgi:hypothetical protein
MYGPDHVRVENAVKYLSWQKAVHKFNIVALKDPLVFLVANEPKRVTLAKEVTLIDCSG